MTGYSIAPNIPWPPGIPSALNRPTGGRVVPAIFADRCRTIMMIGGSKILIVLNANGMGQAVLFPGRL